MNMKIEDYINMLTDEEKLVFYLGVAYGVILHKKEKTKKEENNNEYIR